MVPVMAPSLSAVLFCLALCAVFVWLAVRRMQAGKPHRVFLWLARFFGVMVVMGVDSICKAEGIILEGLVVVAGAVMMLMIVSGIIRELGARKKAEPDSSQSEVTEAPKEEEAPVQEQEDEERKEGPALLLPIQEKSAENINVSTLPRRRVKIMELFGMVLMVFGMGMVVYCLSGKNEHKVLSPFMHKMNAVRDLTPQDLEKMNLSPKEKEDLQEIINELRRVNPRK